MRTTQRRRGHFAPIAVAAALTVAAGLAAAPPASADETAAGVVSTHSAAGDRAGRYIVKRDTTVAASQFEAALRNAGISLVKEQPSLGLAVVDAPSAAHVATLRNLAGVTAVAPDHTVQSQSLGFDPATQGGSMTNVTELLSARNMWKAGYTGNGIDVALVDTGVAPISSLNASDKVVVGPDLSFESQSASAMYLDSYGHGTAMAGIIAGREVAKGSGASYAADNTNFYGMAPDARIISLKLADRSGAVDVSQMIAAVDWVTTNRKRNGLNIRVLNLSYGTNTSLSWQDDPLSWAAEAAWHEGVVVVASAGNDGATKIGLASPAFNPWLLAVGSSDQKGTPTVADDVVAGFSEVGGGRTRGPDLVAPGMSIVAPGVKGSYIASTYPNAVIGNTFVRGSGTSQSAAVVSGAVALTLQKFPDLTPDEVKRFLMRTAFTIPNVASDSQGKGMVSLAKVLNETPDYGYKQSSVISRGNGGGSINASRNGSYVTVGGSAITGEVDIMGQAWNSAAMATAADTDKAWTSDGQFNGNYWTGAGLANDTTSWAGRTWLGRTWLGRTWLGRTWLGRTWLSASWTGSGWSSATWSSPVGVPSWAGAVWSTNGWG